MCVSSNPLFVAHCILYLWQENFYLLKYGCVCWLYLSWHIVWGGSGCEIALVLCQPENEIFSGLSYNKFTILSSNNTKSSTCSPENYWNITKDTKDPGVYCFDWFCKFCISCIFCTFSNICIFCIFCVFCMFCIFCIFYTFCIVCIFCKFCMFCIFCIVCIFCILCNAILNPSNVWCIWWKICHIFHHMHQTLDGLSILVSKSKFIQFSARLWHQIPKFGESVG